MAVGTCCRATSPGSASLPKGSRVETVAFAAALDAVARVEPAVADAILQRAGRPAHPPEADRQRELRQPCGAAGDGQLAERQVRGGRSRSPPLRRLRQRRHHRVARATSWRARCSAPTTPTPSRTAGSTPTWSRSGRCCRSGSSHRRWSASAPDTSTISPTSDWESLRQELGNQTLLGMSLQAGGHLTHGFRPNISGQAVPPPLVRRRSRDVSPRLRRGPTAGARGTAADPRSPATARTRGS